MELHTQPSCGLLGGFRSAIPGVRLTLTLTPMPGPGNGGPGGAVTTAKSRLSSVKMPTKSSVTHCVVTN